MKKLSVLVLIAMLSFVACKKDNCSAVDLTKVSLAYSSASLDHVNKNTKESCAALKTAVTDFINLLEDCPDLSSTIEVGDLKTELADLQKECP